MLDKDGSSPAIRWLRCVPGALLVLYLLGLLGFATRYLPGRRAEVLARWGRTLDVTVTDRHSDIELWVERVRTESHLFASYPSVRAFVQGLSRPAQDHHAEGLLADGVEALHLARASVLASDGRTLQSTPDSGEAWREAARIALATGETSIRLSRNGDATEAIFAGPVAADASPGGRPVGAIVISASASAELFPLLVAPRQLRTGRLFLVGLSADSVRYLSPGADGRIPKASRVAGIAALVAAGAVENVQAMKDDRGRDVVAMIRPVAGTPWWVLAHVDRDEALEGFAWSMVKVAVMWTLLFAALGSGVLSLWWGLLRAMAAARFREQAGFAELLNHARDAIVIVRSDGSVLAVNDQAGVMVGCPSESLVGRAVSDFLIPEQRETTATRRAAVLQQGDAIYQSIVATASGERIPVEIGTRVAEKDGAPVIVAVVRDLRDRLDAERRLAQLNRMLRIRTEISQLIIRETDLGCLLDGACDVVVNRGGFRMAYAGIPRPGGAVDIVSFAGPDERLRKDLVVRWDDSPNGDGTVGRAIKERRTQAVGDIASNPRLAPWQSISVQLGVCAGAATPLCSGDRVLGVLALFSADAGEFDDQIVALTDQIGQDLGRALGELERRAALAEAEARAALSAAAFLQAAEAVIITDTSGRIVDVNPAFERITGYPRDEVLGQNPRLLKSGRQDGAFYRELWTTLAKGNVFAGEMTNRTKAGNLYTAEVVISAVRGADGAIVNYVALQRDVTHERALDTQLRQSQKLEAIGQFTGGIAHDFNNLLGIVLANVSLASSELPGDSYQLRGYLRDIEQATLRGSAMVRKLLAFGRRERLEMVPADLGAATSELVKVLRRVVPESIEILCDIVEPLPAVRADVGAFEQVIVNLATNARDAMPGGGALRLRVEAAVLDSHMIPAGAATPSGKYVVVSASDTGTGMDAATMGKVFEPFYTTKQPGQGTGLGLAMVFGIMQQHKGFVRVESTPGQGSTFKLYFPAVAGAVAALVHAAPVVAPARGAGESILLVEDEPLLRQGAARILERHGYQVTVAGDGEQGWERFQECGSLALVITDAVMPRLGGAELIARIRESGSTVPCLMATGYGPGNGGTANLADRIIGKPWKTEDLLRAVRELLDSRTPASVPA